MTITSEFFKIAADVAGEDVSANYPNNITGSINAVADAITGSDADDGKNISEAVAVLGEAITSGGGGGSTVKVEIKFDNLSSVKVDSTAQTIPSSSPMTLDVPAGSWIEIKKTAGMSTASIMYYPYQLSNYNKELNFVVPKAQSTVQVQCYDN